MDVIFLLNMTRLHEQLTKLFPLSRIMSYGAVYKTISEPVAVLYSIFALSIYESELPYRNNEGHHVYHLFGMLDPTAVWRIH